VVAQRALPHHAAPGVEARGVVGANPAAVAAADAAVRVDEHGARATVARDGQGREAGQAVLGDDLQGGIGDLAPAGAGGLAFGHG